MWLVWFGVCMISLLGGVSFGYMIGYHDGWMKRLREERPDAG